MPTSNRSYTVHRILIFSRPY